VEMVQNLIRWNDACIEVARLEKLRRKLRIAAVQRTATSATREKAAIIIQKVTLKAAIDKSMLLPLYTDEALLHQLLTNGQQGRFIVLKTAGKEEVQK